jgi:cytochrome b involved in lipid metabolism
MQRHSRMNRSGIDADAFSSGHPGGLDIVLKCKNSDFVSENHGTILQKAV